MGMPNQQRVGLTEIVINRLVQIADPDESDQILSNSLRDLDDAWYQDEKKLFDDSRDLDDFLDVNAQNFIAMLEKIKDEGGLFFTQKITEEVLEYVRNEPLIARGIREGECLIRSKNSTYDSGIPGGNRPPDEALLLLPLSLGKRVPQG